MGPEEFASHSKFLLVICLVKYRHYYALSVAERKVRANEFVGHYCCPLLITAVYATGIQQVDFFLFLKSTLSLRPKISVTCPLSSNFTKKLTDGYANM